MKEKQKPPNSIFPSRKNKTISALIILTLALCLNGCAAARTHDAASQSLTYPQGRKFPTALQTEAAAEIESLGCDPDKNVEKTDCQIPALLTLLKDAMNVLDQLAVARDAQRSGN